MFYISKANMHLAHVGNYLFFRTTDNSRGLTSHRIKRRNEK
jgi:hypothetical protein